MINYQPKVLVAAPVSAYKDYARTQWIDTVKSLSYSNYSVYAVDNSSDQTYHAINFIMKGIDCDYVSPKGKKNNFYVMESQRMIAQRVIDGGYDFLCFIEQDISVPDDILQQLLAYQYPLVTVDYFIDQGANSKLLRMEMEPEPFFGKYTNRMMLQEECYLEYGTGKTRSWYVPFGCTLIHREILENFPFFVIEGDAFKSHADVPFSFSLYEAGIKPIVHPIIVRHSNSDWAKITDR